MESKRICDGFADPMTRSIIRDSTRVTGNISGPGDLALDGELQGDISISGLLVIGEKGSVQGKVTAGNMILAGRVLGSVRVEVGIEIRSSGRMKGDVVCAKIAIAEGAFLEGGIYTHEGKTLAPDYFTEKRKDLQGRSGTKP
ncbi:MAG: polymer-forming cytoskeletal protein [Acidobacteriota bacterium]|nr:polymer-forming cytoskeletal protein [Acidobacteriota bacterium]